MTQQIKKSLHGSRCHTRHKIKWLFFSSFFCDVVCQISFQSSWRSEVVLFLDEANFFFQAYFNLICWAIKAKLGPDFLSTSLLFTVHHIAAPLNREASHLRNIWQPSRWLALRNEVSLQCCRIPLPNCRKAALFVRIIAQNGSTPYVLSSFIIIIAVVVVVIHQETGS